MLLAHIYLADHMLKSLPFIVDEFLRTQSFIFQFAIAGQIIGEIFGEFKAL